MHYYLIINGPKRVGKDSIALGLRESLSEHFNVFIWHFASALKRSVNISFGLEGFPDDYFEKVKDEPNPLFKGVTPRQAWINHAELYMRKLYGKGIYAEILKRNMEDALDIYSDRKPALHIIADARIKEEIDTFIAGMPKREFLLINLYRMGYSFNKDTGEYYFNPEINRKTLFNKELPDVIEEAANLVKKQFLLYN